MSELKNLTYSDLRSMCTIMKKDGVIGKKEVACNASRDQLITHIQTKKYKKYLPITGVKSPSPRSKSPSPRSKSPASKAVQVGMPDRARLQELCKKHKDQMGSLRCTAKSVDIYEKLVSIGVLQSSASSSKVVPKAKPSAPVPAPRTKPSAPVPAPRTAPVPAPRTKPVAAPRTKPVAAPRTKPVAAPRTTKSPQETYLIDGREVDRNEIKVFIKEHKEYFRDIKLNMKVQDLVNALEEFSRQYPGKLKNAGPLIAPTKNKDDVLTKAVKDAKKDIKSRPVTSPLPATSSRDMLDQIDTPAGVVVGKPEEVQQFKPSTKPVVGSNREMIRKCLATL